MRLILSLSGTISTAISTLDLLLSRIITTTSTLLLAMAGLVLVALSPAQAVDMYYPCAGMVSTVSPGTTTYYSQSISCAITHVNPACGTWGQLYRVEWYMTVSSGGVTVRYLRLTVTHTQGEDITISAKEVLGANRTYYFPVDQVPANQVTWSRVYDVRPDTYFTKRRFNDTVEFLFYMTSSRADACSTAWRPLRYQLKIG